MATAAAGGSGKAELSVVTGRRKYGHGRSWSRGAWLVGDERLTDGPRPGLIFQVISNAPNLKFKNMIFLLSTILGTF
jgi:hypothetical protein